MLAHMANAEFSDDELSGLDVPVAFVVAELDEFCPPHVMKAASERFRTLRSTSSPVRGTRPITSYRASGTSLC